MAGVRIDWNPSERNSLTVEGGGYQGGVQNQAFSFPGPGQPQTMMFNSARLRGGHFPAHCSHQVSASSSTEVPGYCDWTDRVSFATEARNACDLEFQNNVQISPRPSIVWGGSAETSNSTTNQSFASVGVPEQLRTTTLGGFGQYEFALIPGDLRLITGAKLENNSYTRFEIEPQVHGVWSPNSMHTIWGAVSRAVRTPTRLVNGEQFKFVQLPSPVPTYLTAVGNPNLEYQVLRAYELGCGFTWSISGHDMTSGRHWENRPALFTTTGSEVGPTVVFKISWQSQRSRQQKSNDGRPRFTPGILAARR